MSVKPQTNQSVEIYFTKAALLRNERIARQIAADPEYQSYKARQEQLARAKELSKNKPVVRKRPTGSVAVKHKGTNNQDVYSVLQSQKTNDFQRRLMEETFVKRPRSTKRKSIASSVRNKERIIRAPKKKLHKKPHTIAEEEENEIPFRPTVRPLPMASPVVPKSRASSPLVQRSRASTPLVQRSRASTPLTYSDEEIPEKEEMQPYLKDSEGEVTEDEEAEERPFANVESEEEGPEEAGDDRASKRPDHEEEEDRHSTRANTDDDEDEIDNPPEEPKTFLEKEPETGTSNAFNVARLLASYSTKERLIGATEARKDLSVEVNPPIEEYIKAGTVPLLVKCLSNDNDEIIMQAAWALTNIASGSSEQTQIVADEGAIPLLVINLRRKDEKVVDQCVWALGNIAGDGAKFKQQVINVGAVKSLTALIKPNTPTKYLRNLSWTMSNLFRKQPTVMRPEDLNLILDKMKILCKSSDEEVLRDAFWTLSYIADDEEKADQLIKQGFIPIILSKLKSNNGKLQMPLLRAIGNLSAGTDEQAEAVISSGALQEVLKIMSDRKKLSTRTRKDATWILANVLAGKPSQIKAAVDGGCLPILQDIVSKDTDEDLLKEAGWCIANLSQCDQPKIIDKAVLLDLPRGLTSILFKFMSESAYKAVCLEALYNLFTGTSKKSECYKSIFHDKSEDDFDVFVDSYEPADKRAKKHATALLDKVSVFKIQEFKDQRGHQLT